MAEKKGLRIRKISNNMTKSNQSREIEIINGTKIYLTKKQKKSHGQLKGTFAHYLC